MNLTDGLSMFGVKMSAQAWIAFVLGLSSLGNFLINRLTTLHDTVKGESATEERVQAEEKDTSELKIQVARVEGKVDSILLFLTRDQKPVTIISDPHHQK